MTDTPATHRVTEGLPDPDAALRLLAEAEAADGVEAFGEAFVRGLTDADAGHRHFHVPAADGSGELLSIRDRSSGPRPRRYVVASIAMSSTILLRRFFGACSLTNG